MKKFIAIIVMLLSVIVANAQIKITKTSNDRLVEVKSLFMADANRLVRSGDSYIYVAKTSNQFDDAMPLLLGDSKEEILASLNTLYEAVDAIGDEEIITIDNGYGIEYRLKKWIPTEKDIKLALDTCKEEGNEDVILLKCTSAYPAPFEAVNLEMIPFLSTVTSIMSFQPMMPSLNMFPPEVLCFCSEVSSVFMLVE